MTDTTPSPDNTSPVSLIRVLIKAAVLFVILNLLYVWIQPLPLIGKASIYNTIVPGRHRLPFGENPESYNLSLFQLEATFASHEVSVPKAPDEYRVLVMGDSSVWGILLTPEETLAAYINQGEYTTADGRNVRAYNLGYPTISVGKDLMLLSYAIEYEPDMIVWLTTLEAMPAGKQVSSAIVQYNPAVMRGLIETYALPINPADPAFADSTFWDRTIIGQRRELANVVRLNAYGFAWASTGIDQFYPDPYTPRQEDFEADDSFYDFAPPLAESDLAFEVLDAGSTLVGDVPLLIVNEPIFISSGQNSDLRYNAYYPRWAYDDYRRLMSEHAQAAGWHYLDLWDGIPNTEYTNSAIHLTPRGSQQLAALVGKAIVALADGK